MLELWEMPGHLIRRLHQASVSLFLEEVGSAGHALTPVQFAAMCAIRANPGLDQATLAGLIAYDRVTIAGETRRARELALSQAGEDAVERATPAVRHAQVRMLDGLDPNEREVFLRLLTKATAAANDHSRAPLRMSG